MIAASQIWKFGKPGFGRRYVSPETPEKRKHEADNMRALIARMEDSGDPCDMNKRKGCLFVLVDYFNGVNDRRKSDPFPDLSHWNVRATEQKLITDYENGRFSFHFLGVLRTAVKVSYRTNKGVYVFDSDLCKREYFGNRAQLRAAVGFNRFLWENGNLTPKAFCEIFNITDSELLLGYMSMRENIPIHISLATYAYYCFVTPENRNTEVMRQLSWRFSGKVYVEGEDPFEFDYEKIARKCVKDARKNASK